MYLSLGPIIWSICRLGQTITETVKDSIADKIIEDECRIRYFWGVVDLRTYLLSVPPEKHKIFWKDRTPWSESTNLDSKDSYRYRARLNLRKQRQKVLLFEYWSKIFFVSLGILQEAWDLIWRYDLDQE